MNELPKDKAYIAIRNDGFVEGACFTESPDAQEWCRKMEAAGFEVHIRNRAEAKEILFTHIGKYGVLVA